MGLAPEDEQGTTFTSDYHGIDVDASGLDKFAGSVGGEVDKNFEPHVHRLFSVYSLPQTFGVNVRSNEIQSALTKHADCLQGAGETLAAYINASRILIEAIRQVQANYGGADALASAQSEQVDAVLHKAIAQSEEATRAAGVNPGRGAQGWTAV